MSSFNLEYPSVILRAEWPNHQRIKSSCTRFFRNQVVLNRRNAWKPCIPVALRRSRNALSLGGSPLPKRKPLRPFANSAMRLAAGPAISTVLKAEIVLGSCSRRRQSDVCTVTGLRRSTRRSLKNQFSEPELRRSIDHWTPTKCKEQRRLRLPSRLLARSAPKLQTADFVFRQLEHQ
jgi:hypothetical protein